MNLVILSLAVLISAIIAIIYRQRDNIKMYTIFKPLTTLLIIAIALIIHYNVKSEYSRFVIIALLFSLLGDILLINKRYFVYGLASFLFAHLMFIRCFYAIYGFNAYLLPLIILLIIGGLYFLYLRKTLGKYLIPVAIYLIVIVTMSWQAVGLVINEAIFVNWSIAAGSILFFFSDSIIAYNKFKKPFKIAEILILASYWLSIFILTLAGKYLILG